ncbi:MAG: hypothetical protein HYU42_10145 [Candidatus Rokubacteria bacterium]|nr:hypothetical protein [Candidatus Rokubacteria bacterium]
MSYAAYLRPRAETLAGEIEGIIDLANLKDTRRKRLEARPDVFFSLTYPTADVRQVVSLLDQRFGEKAGAPGLFLFEGLKGSGKSHLLLLVYHLFRSPNEARRWLDRHGLRCRLPERVTPVVNKFTDLPLSSIWDFVFEQVKGQRPPRSMVQPSLTEVESALAGRQVVLIFDELEQGVRVLADAAVRAQNIAFLQMLSEWANRSVQVTLFASIYSDQQEPGATLKRVAACRVQFAQAEDRARVVLHRAFENYLDFKADSVAPVIGSYLNRFIAGAGGLEIEEEPLGTAASREDVAIFLSQHVYPPQLLAEHLEARLAQVKGQGVREIDREYRSTLGFPVPTHAGSLTRAVRSLCRERKLGIYHSRSNFCGADPALSDAELLDAVVAEPFEGSEALPSSPPRTGTPSSPVAGQVPPERGQRPTLTEGEQLPVRTGSQTGIGPLRQAVAALLQEHASARVHRARFTVFLQQTTGDLSSLPAAYRGSLAGPGSLTIEIAITKEEELSKAQVEQMIERLPNVPHAEYSADLILLLPAAEDRAQS